MRRKDFSFLLDGKECTLAVINITFNYSYKEFNQAGINRYVKAGHAIRFSDFDDCACVQDGEIVGIQINKPVKSPLPNELLTPYFEFDGECYRKVKEPKTLKNVSELREELYRDGFTCDGIEYVRYKRSSGSSRVGKCLFVRRELARRMQQYDRCGIRLSGGDPIDLSAYEAYISLPMSSIIDTVEILPENILLIDDYESEFEDTVASVDLVDGKLHAEEKRVKIKNNIWDGQSLMDISLFGKYANKGMLLLRNQFFKTCAFNTNLQQWFSDNGITEISQLKGKTLATRIEDVKLVTTPSSVKYLKFGTFHQWLKRIGSTFGIVKFEKTTKYFSGRKAKSHYQLLNTLNLSQNDVNEVLAPSFDYITKVREDPDVLRYHISYPVHRQFPDEQIPNKNAVVFRLLGINNDFSKTNLYKKFRSNLVTSMLRELKCGHVLINGNYSTLFGNGYEMLKSSIGLFDGVSEIGTGNIYSTRFPAGSEILGSRSPHITMGNILLVKNRKNKHIDRYFNLTHEIVCVNAINENIQQRLNGCDYDSDTILLTDDPLLVSAARKYYDVFLVPTNEVCAQKVRRQYTESEKADLDTKTSVNKIGEIVNLSQQLNTILWDRINHGGSISQCSELYLDICKLSVLSGIEIDKAKKEYDVNSVREIKTLKQKYKILSDDGRAVKPMFFKMISRENGFSLQDNKISYRYFDSSMDYLHKAILKYGRSYRAKDTETISLASMLVKPTGNYRHSYYYKERKRVIEAVRTLKADISATFSGVISGTDDLTDRRFYVQNLKADCIRYIRNLNITKSSMYLLLESIESKENSDIRGLLFEILFASMNRSMYDLIIESRSPLFRLYEDPDGDVELYDLSFTKRIA